MNSLIVIFLFFKNILKKIKPSIVNLILSCIGLSFALYVYNKYNSVQQQRIKIISQLHGNAKTFSQSAFMILGYSSTEKNRTEFHSVSLDTIIDNSSAFSIQQCILYPDVSSTFSVDSIFGFLETNDLHIDSIIKCYNPNYYITTELYWDYSDNNWFVFHPSFALRRHAGWKTQTNIEQQRDSSIQIKKFEKYSYFPDEENRWEQQWVNHSKHIFLNKSKDIALGVSNCTDGLGFNYNPNWFSAYDLSEFQINILPQIDSLSKFNVLFTDVCEYNNVYPIPDKQDIEGIEYTDSIKLDYIQHNGVKLFLHFPKLKSMQDCRNYILSFFITLFIGLVSKIIIDLIKKALAHRKKRKKIIKLLIDNNKLNKAKKLYTFNVIATTITVMFFVLMVSFINPYHQSKWGQVILFIIYTLSIVYLIDAVETKFFYKKRNLTFRNKKLNRFIVLTLVLLFIIFIVVEWDSFG